MSLSDAATGIAPAELSAVDELNRQAGYFAEQSFARFLLDAVPAPLAILNRNRQIVFANQALFRLSGMEQEAALRGLRPGAVLDCLNAGQAQAGCGTGETCATCGALLAILSGLAGEQVVRECRLGRWRDGRHEALDLQIQATPLAYAGERFTIVTATDISHEKRRRSLERVFFHDLLNLLGSIRGFTELLRDYRLEDKEEIFTLMHAAAQQSIEEIEAQRLLTAAESGELQVSIEPIEVHEFLSRIVEIYRFHPAAEERGLELIPPRCKPFRSDRTLLGRVLGNMIKNALEAARPGECVTVGVEQKEDWIEFRVHNPGVIPRTVQQQIFQRSFSTRGKGRGLGTYSMKLLSDYLQGEVDFVSAEGQGTVFRARYPVSA